MRARPLSSSRSALLEQRARRMRLAPTLSELKLWQALRGGQLGVSLRRQMVVGERIVDFLAPCVRLVVEVDGRYHEERRRAGAGLMHGGRVSSSGWAIGWCASRRT